MKAIWQLVDSIIIPILTYASESWMPTKKEKAKLQMILNDAIKTIPYLPNGTPTTILLNETGLIPVEYTITKKQILQTKRIDEMKSDANKSTWRKMIDEKAEDLHIKDVMTVTKKNPLKVLIQKEIEAKINEQIDNEAELKTKVKHWRERRQTTKIGVRPEYMDKLNRKQCNAIMKARASMIKVKSNYKKGNETNLNCRFCKKDKETQEHILQNCPEMAKIVGKCEYENIFRDDVKTLREQNPELPSMSSSTRSEPPG